MKDLYIIGTGSQARYIIETCKDYSIKGLIDILNVDNVGKDINGVKVVCFLDDIDKFVNKDCEVIVAYGGNKKKKEIVEMLVEKGYKFATIVSENAYVSKFVKIGKGCIINPNVTIMPNVTIKDHVIVHSGSVIEHDNVLCDYVNVAPGVVTGGNVTVGEGSYLYTGVVVIPKVNIGKNVIVGAGSVVIKDVSDDVTVVGVPSRELKK